MTQWNDYVKEFADKKKIAYGCAIVRNDLRKAYAKKYDPVPRNRGIYTTRNEDGTIKQMGRGQRKEAKIRPPEAVKASALKRTASFKKRAEEKEEANKKLNEKYQAELAERRQKEADDKAKAEAERARVLEVGRKKVEEEKAKAEADKIAKAEKDRLALLEAQGQTKRQQDERKRKDEIRSENAKSYSGITYPRGSGGYSTNEHRDVGTWKIDLDFNIKGENGKSVIVDSEYKNDVKNIYDGESDTLPDTWEKIGTLTKKDGKVDLSFTSKFRQTDAYKKYKKMKEEKVERAYVDAFQKELSSKGIGGNQQLANKVYELLTYGDGFKDNEIFSLSTTGASEDRSDGGGATRFWTGDYKDKKTWTYRGYVKSNYQASRNPTFIYTLYLTPEFLKTPEWNKIKDSPLLKTNQFVLAPFVEKTYKYKTDLMEKR